MAKDKNEEIDDWVDVPISKNDQEIDDWQDVPLDTKSSAVPLPSTEKNNPKYSKLDSSLRGAGQGLTFGFSDEIAGAIKGAVPALFTDETLGEGYRKARDLSRAKDKLAQEQNPKYFDRSEIASSLLSSFLPGVGAIGKVGQGAKALALARAGATSGATLGLGKSGADLTKGEFDKVTLDMIPGAAIGGVGGALIPKTVSLGKNILSKTDDVLKNAPSEFAKQNFGSVVDFINEYAPQLKPNASKISQSADDLGIKPTPGMLYDSPFIQKTESALQQSPTLLAAPFRKARTEVEEGITGAVTGSTKNTTNLSKSELGDLVKKRIYEGVNQKFDPIKELYDDVYKYTKDIDVNPKSLQRVLQNTKKDETVRLGLGEASKAVEALEKRSGEKISADGLRQMISSLKGLSRGTVSGSEQKSIQELIGRLERVQDNTIKRRAVESARTGSEGKKIGQEIVDQLNQAKNLYREEIGNLSDFASKSGMKRFQGQQQFKDNLEDLVSEKLTDKFYPVSNKSLREKTNELFPQAADLLKQSRVTDLVNKATKDGQIDSRSFLNQTKGYEDDLLADLFGPQNKINQARTVSESIQGKVGQSGTPEGLGYFSAGAFNPKNYISDAKNVVGLKIAQNAGNIASGLNSMVKNTPEFFGKYANVLQQASIRGGNSLAATNYVLQQSDPEYREKIRQMNEGVDEQ